MSYRVRKVLAFLLSYKKEVALINAIISILPLYFALSNWIAFCWSIKYISFAFLARARSSENAVITRLISTFLRAHKARVLLSELFSSLMRFSLDLVAYNTLEEAGETKVGVLQRQGSRLEGIGVLRVKAFYPFA